MKRDHTEQLASVRESERSVCVHAGELEKEIATLVKQCDDRTQELMGAQTALDTERKAHRRTQTELAAINYAAITIRHARFDELRTLQNKIALQPGQPGRLVSHDEIAKLIEETIARIPLIEASIGIVKRPPPPPPPVAPLAPNELRTEVNDDLAQAAADHANVAKDKSHLPRDPELVRLAVELETDPCSHWDDRASGFVNGARWQAKRGVQAELDRLLKGQSISHTDDDVQAGSRGMSVEDAIHRYAPGPYQSLAEITDAWFGRTGNVAVDAASRVLALFALKRVEAPDEPQRDVSLALAPIAFRDNDERAYWDSVTLMLARKADTTAQSVASAADEMVEERRARQEVTEVVQGESNNEILSIARKWFDIGIKVESYSTTGWKKNKKRVFDAAWSGFTGLVLGESSLSIDETNAYDVGKKNAHDNPIIETKSTEPSDKLLRKASKYANGVSRHSTRSDELDYARKTLVGHGEGMYHWTLRAYVAGALGK